MFAEGLRPGVKWFQLVCAAVLRPPKRPPGSPPVLAHISNLDVCDMKGERHTSEIHFTQRDTRGKVFGARPPRFPIDTARVHPTQRAAPYAYACVCAPLLYARQINHLNRAVHFESVKKGNRCNLNAGIKFAALSVSQHTRAHTHKHSHSSE